MRKTQDSKQGHYPVISQGHNGQGRQDVLSALLRVCRRALFIIGFLGGLMLLLTPGEGAAQGFFPSPRPVITITAPSAGQALALAQN